MLSQLTSSHSQLQEIMEALVDGPQEPYLATPKFSTYENLKFYNKAIVGLP